MTKEGKFADLAFDNGKEQVNFTSAGPGLVRVAFPTAELSSGINAAANGNNGGAAEDPQTKQTQDQMKQAMAAYFAGHFLTLRIEGGEITDSNMTIAADKQSAEDEDSLRRPDQRHRQIPCRTIRCREGEVGRQQTPFRTRPP